MDSKKLKESLSKWNNVEDIQRVAFEFFLATNGDARKLAGSYLFENGVFGEVAIKLFGENLEFHRFLLWNIWKSNKCNCRDHFAMVAREKGQRKKLQSTPYGDKAKASTVLCWCQLSVEVSDGRRMSTVTCEKCKKRFHSICAGISVESFSEDHSYVCIECSKTPRVPRLFRQPFRDQHRFKNMLVVTSDADRFKDEDDSEEENRPPELTGDPREEIHVADTPRRLFSNMRRTVFKGLFTKDESTKTEECFGKKKKKSPQVSQDDAFSIGEGVSGDDLLNEPLNNKNDAQKDDIEFPNSSEEDDFASIHNDESDDSRKFQLPVPASKRNKGMDSEHSPKYGWKTSPSEINMKSRGSTESEDDDDDNSKFYSPVMPDKFTHSSGSNAADNVKPRPKGYENSGFDMDDDGENDVDLNCQTGNDDEDLLKTPRSGSPNSSFEDLTRKEEEETNSKGRKKAVFFSPQKKWMKNIRKFANKVNPAKASPPPSLKHSFSDLSSNEDSSTYDNTASAKTKNKKTSKPSKIDTSGIPTRWTAKFTKEEWDLLLPMDKASGRYHVNSDYGDILQDKLTEVNPVCVIKCGKRSLFQRGDKDYGTKAFFTAYTSCKGKNCKASHIFKLEKEPKRTDEYVYLKAKVSGKTICHYEGEDNRRHLKGRKRVEMKEKLKHELPSNVYRKNFAKQDITKVQKGNLDHVKKLKVFQQARVEVKREEDFHDKVLVDLFATKNDFSTKYTFPQFNGYIQEISLYPFIVVLYTRESLTLFRQLTRSGTVAFYIDATSNISKSLVDFDSRKIFYYVVVIKSKSGQPVPVCEFFTAQQDFMAIQYALECFLQRFKRVYNIRSFNYNVSRVEIDMSLATLAAASRVFTGLDVEQFLKSVWNAMIEKRRIQFAIHICRIHVTKFLRKKIEEVYPTKAIAAQAEAYLKPWVYRFVATKSMSDLSACIEEVLIVIGSKYKTTRVVNITTTDGEGFNGRGYKLWRTFNIEEVKKEDPFFLRSPFGAFFSSMADRITEENDDRSDVMEEKNIFFSKQLLSYFRKTIFPYAPLLTKIPFVMTNQAIENDNTNLAEYWHKILKKDILQGAKPQKITRVIREIADNVVGAVREALSKFPLAEDDRSQPVEQSDSSESESEEIEEWDRNADEKVDKDSPHRAVDGFKTLKRSKREPTGTVVSEMEVIPGGGHYKGITFLHTCSFDAVIQAMYYIYNYTSVGRSFVDEMAADHSATNGKGHYVVEVMRLIAEKKFGKAKYVWVHDLLMKKLKDPVVDMWGEEDEQGLGALDGWFPLVKRMECLAKHCDMNTRRPKLINSTYLLPSSQSEFVEKMEVGDRKPCKVCKKEARVYYNEKPGHDYKIFAYTHAAWVREYEEGILDVQYPKFTERDLHSTMTFFGRKFKLLCYSLYRGDHYILIIMQGKRRMACDGLRASAGLIPWTEPNERFMVSTVWLTSENTE